MWIAPKKGIEMLELSAMQTGLRCPVGNAYIVAVLGLPQLDVLRGQSFDVTGLIDDAGAGRACADINADVVVL